VLDAEPAVAYALLFGSGARGTGHAGSDTDVAVELRHPAVGRRQRHVQDVGRRQRPHVLPEEAIDDFD
jgi:predicted nucleotidyltransferase